MATFGSKDAGVDAVGNLAVLVECLIQTLINKGTIVASDLSTVHNAADSKGVLATHGNRMQTRRAS